MLLAKQPDGKLLVRNIGKRLVRLDGEPLLRGADHILKNNFTHEINVCGIRFMVSLEFGRKSE